MNLLFRSTRGFLRGKERLWHVRANLPLVQDKQDEFIKILQEAKNSGDSALCISISSGCTNQKTQYNHLYDSILSTVEGMRAPVYSFIEDSATAEGYLLATAATTISATPFSLLGELGVYKTYNNYNKLLEKFGFSLEQIHMGDGGSIWPQLGKSHPKQKQFTQKYVKDLEDQLISRVSGRRNIPREQLQTLRGRLLTAKQALELKLIDHVRTFDEFKHISYPNHKVIEKRLGSSLPILQLTSMEKATIQEFLDRLSVQGSPALEMPKNGQLINRLKTILAQRQEDQQFMTFFDEKVCPKLLDLLGSQTI